MKTALRKLLRLTHLDTLILGLVEKLALGLVKKLSTLAENARGFLDRITDN